MPKCGLFRLYLCKGVFGIIHSNILEKPQLQQVLVNGGQRLYVSKFIPKYQKFGIAVISVRKNVLPQVVMILDNFVPSKV